MERYVIRGGRAGYDRLQLLARDRWPTTRALFARAGVGAGMRCIDLGCGGGEVTFELAKLVAPDGDVVGVDMDEIKLALAREAAADRGITNVEFRALNVDVGTSPRPTTWSTAGFCSSTSASPSRSCAGCGPRCAPVG